MSTLENWFLQARDALVSKGEAAVIEAINTPANPIATNPVPLPAQLAKQKAGMTMIVIVVIVITLLFAFKKKVI